MDIGWAITPGVRSAVSLDHLVGAATAADLPVEQPTEFDLVINLTTAKALSAS